MMRWLYIVPLYVLFIVPLIVLFILGRFAITAFVQYFEEHAAEVFAYGFRWGLSALFCWTGVLFLDSNDFIGAIVSVAVGAGCVIWAICAMKAKKG